jgi:Zn-dependent protease
MGKKLSSSWNGIIVQELCMFNLDPSTLISYMFVLLTSFSVHEFAHAWTANYFGDLTPKMNGRLTLNPLAHLDPIGSLLLLVAGFGWAKPVPVNPYALQRRSPSALMWVSLAGPLSNFLMAILAAIPFRVGWVSIQDAQMALATRSSHFFPTIPQLLWVFININLLLMLFNLIPIAPLDGEKILEYFLPPAGSRFLDTIRPFGPMILLAIVFLGVLGWIIYPPLSLLMSVLVG